MSYNKINLTEPQKQREKEGGSAPNSQEGRGEITQPAAQPIENTDVDTAFQRLTSDEQHHEAN